MKIFKFYFFIGLAFVACAPFLAHLTQSIPGQYYTTPNQKIVLLSQVLIAILLLSPIRILKIAKETTWIRIVFIPIAVVAWGQAINTLLSDDIRPAFLSPLTPMLQGFAGFVQEPSLTVLAAFCWTIGCLAVSRPAVSKYFKVQGWCFGALFLFIVLQRAEILAGTQSISPILTAMLFVPLLGLNFRCSRLQREVLASTEDYELTLDDENPVTLKRPNYIILFRFYFSLVIFAILTSTVISAKYLLSQGHLLYGVHASTGWRWVAFFIVFLRGVTALIPLSIARYFHESESVKNLFTIRAVMALVAVVLFAFFSAASPLVLQTGRGSSTIMLFVQELLAIAEIITLFMGCYKVQHPVIRQSFRQLAGLFIFSMLFLFAITVIGKFAQWPSNILSGITYLTSMIPEIGYLLLLYRSWNEPLAQEQWQSAIESIGTPEAT